MKQSQAFLLAIGACLAAIAWAGNTHYYKPDLGHNAKRGPRRVQNMPKTLAKRITNGYGLLDSSQTLYRNGIALGWLPDFTAAGAVKSINDALPRPMSVIGDYVQIYTDEDQANPPLIQVDYHLANITTGNPATQPVYMVSLMPQDGFAAVTDAVIDAVVDKMAALNSLGVPVWLRYAFEMNLGPGFNAWSGQPTSFIENWRRMAIAIKTRTTNTFMLWSPNVDVERNPNYEQYFPGSDYVDLYGLSIYSFAANSRQNNDALSGNEFALTFTPFYNIYGVGNNPIVVSETSKPYNYVLGGYPTDPAPGTAQGDEPQTKTDWFRQLTFPATKDAFPNLISVNWFEYLKNEVGRTVDFRSLTGMSRVRSAVAGYLDA